MTSDPNVPDTGKTEEGKSKWEESGFSTEAEMIEAAKSATDLRSKIEEAESILEKERAAKTKTNADYLRQSNEIGELRKKLKELEETKPSEQKQLIKEENEDEILDSLSVEDVTMFDGILNDPKNTELKKRILIGGNKAMAEFVKTYRVEAPVDLSVSLFAGLKRKKADTVPLSSIAKAVKDLFAQKNQEDKNNLAAVPGSGAIPDRLAKTKKQVIVGGVDVDFFKKQQ